MAKKKDEKDVLVVRDEKTGEISVVAGLNADGTPKRTPAKAENAQSFLQFDRHGDVLDNFFKNFFRQCKEPSRFGFYRIAADQAENLLEVMNENNDVFTMEDEPIASVVQDMRKGSKWLSAFLESYRPPLDGERYLTDGEVSELLRVSRRTLQEYRNNRVLPFILLGGKVLYPETGLRGVLEANYRKPLE
jgi:hypothetical protein